MYKEYRARHPEVDFQLTLSAGGAMDNGQKLMAELAAGLGPDVLHDTTYDQVRGGYCLDLTDHIASWKDRFYPPALASCTWDGRIYNLPTEYSMVPCIWNLATLASVGKKVPQTFEEYMDVGDALRRKNIDFTSLSVSGHHIFFSIVFGYPEATELIARKQWRSEPFRDAMNVIRQIVAAKLLPSNDAEIVFGQAASLFQQDRLGHYMNGAWTINNEILSPGVPEALRHHVAFTPFPSYRGVRPIRAWAATKSALNHNLGDDPAKLKAGLAFVELMTSPESARRFVSQARSPQGVKIDVTRQMAGDLLYDHMNSYRQATSVFAFPNNPGFFSEQVAGQALPNAFVCLQEGGTLDAAMTVFAEGMSL